MDIKQKRAMRAQQRRDAKKLTGKRWKKLMATESVAGTSVTGLSIKLGPLRYDDEACSSGGYDWRRDFYRLSGEGMEMTNEVSSDRHSSD